MRARAARHHGDVSFRINRSDGTSRRVIDLALGILIGLRGCSADEAFAELVEVVGRTGVGVGSIATGLVALASGEAPADHPAAYEVWGDLVAQHRPVAVTNWA